MEDIILSIHARHLYFLLIHWTTQGILKTCCVQRCPPPRPGDCFTNVSRALQNNLAKIYNASNHIYSEKFKLELCTCTQSHALGTQTKCQLEMLIGNAIFATHTFRENVLESSRNVSEKKPRSLNKKADTLHTETENKTLIYSGRHHWIKNWDANYSVITNS